MNKRQEIAVWVLGVVLAAISAYEGSRGGGWIFEAFVPVLIIGVLVVNTLRTRSQASPSDVELLKKGLGVVLLVSLFGHLDHRARMAQWEGGEAREEAEHAKSGVEELRSSVDDLESKVRHLEIDALYRR